MIYLPKPYHFCPMFTRDMYNTHSASMINQFAPPLMIRKPGIRSSQWLKYLTFCNYQSILHWGNKSHQIMFKFVFVSYRDIFTLIHIPLLCAWFVFLCLFIGRSLFYVLIICKVILIILFSVKHNWHLSCQAFV